MAPRPPASSLSVSRRATATRAGWHSPRATRAQACRARDRRLDAGGVSVAALRLHEYLCPADAPGGASARRRRGRTFAGIRVAAPILIAHRRSRWRAAVRDTIWRARRAGVLGHRARARHRPLSLRWTRLAPEPAVVSRRHADRVQRAQ